MIESIRGTVLSLTGNRVVVEVSGVGYGVSVTPAAILGVRVGSEIVLRTALVVREDAWHLFGFGSERERELFDLLQSVSGVGPKLALTILSAISSDELLSAIANGDETRLVRIPGVGKKSAARLIVELGDRLPKATVPETSWQLDVRGALASLGWPERDCDWAIAQVVEELGADADPAAALRAALLRLGEAKRR